MGEGWEVLLGDCVESMRAMPAESIDAVVTDPPYGIGFMGHEWDQPGEFGPVDEPGRRQRSQQPASSGAGHQRDRDAAALAEGERDHTKTSARGGAMHAGQYDLSTTANRRFQSWCAVWGEEMLRVLKPGGHAVVFGSPRTAHRLAAGLEDAGFEIRDTLMWLFGSGFPKNLNVGGGRGTALKPGYEPIVMVRKPLVGTVAATVERFGTGALNIDAARVPFRDAEDEEESKTKNQHGDFGSTAGGNQVYGDFSMVERTNYDPVGRWPANVVMDDVAGAMLDAQTGDLGRSTGGRIGNAGGDGPRYVAEGAFMAGDPGYGDSGGPSRFFYCAKTSTAERNAGLGHLPLQKKPTWSSGELEPGTFQAAGTAEEARNVHPTVKPIELMRWLVRLVVPEGGVVLDPFTGSGSTGAAAVLEGRSFVGCEREEEYVELARARIGWWAVQSPEVALADALVAEKKRGDVAAAGQESLFGEAV